MQSHKTIQKHHIWDKLGVFIYLQLASRWSGNWNSATCRRNITYLSSRWRSSTLYRDSSSAGDTTRWLLDDLSGLWNTNHHAYSHPSCYSYPYSCCFAQDVDRVSKFQQGLMDEQKSSQAQERTQLQRAQRSEIKAHLNRFRQDLRRQGLSGAEQRQKLTQVTWWCTESCLFSWFWRITPNTM